MKKIIFIIALACIAQASHAQTDEQLREQIRKEILEEQRLKEEQELLEYRKEKIRREEEARIKAEKDSLNDALLEKQNPKKEYVAPLTRSAQKEKMIAKRIDGWSVSVSAGPNVPLGSYAKSNSDGDFALLGAYVSMDNFWHFGKVMGMVIGLSYDNNAFNAKPFVDQAIMQQGMNPNDFTIRNTTKPYSNVTFRAGPNIRYLGGNASIYFNPFVGLAVHEMFDVISDFTYNGSQFQISIEGKGNVYFVTGADMNVSVHFGGRVDALFGARFTYGHVKVNFVSQSTNTPILNSSDRYSVINLAPNLGFRFHL